MTTIGLILIGVGGVVVYAAYLNQPIAVVVDALITGKPLGQVGESRGPSGGSGGGAF